MKEKKNIVASVKGRLLHIARSEGKSHQLLLHGFCRKSWQNFRAGTSDRSPYRQLDAGGQLSDR
ncbi:hypothetical protein [Phaeodactylibacter sp.]|jgi:hypothetical protein|uniref:hypothetical protein n=1 Tax=Phaeodactylibacter sp. TaxID=1940289 RepID=UPI0025E86DFF|nr:hypothetical protein [Phaeodactylibacter sp.]MCI4651689.1 hypothetical protein [Phaeodactylibacter sp.]MCI5092002.1 hypothetical protein [Phaeodactylibacter sp.]